MAQYRKKPVEIEAIQWNGNTNKQQIDSFVGKTLNTELESETAYLAGIAPPIFSLLIETKEGIMKAFKGDWIIKEPFPTGDRDFYPCKPDIFEKTYDAETTSFKERLIKEHEELSDKLNKLYTFGSTEKFKELDPIHQQLLIIQSGSMATYNETLKLRLGLL